MMNEQIRIYLGKIQKLSNDFIEDIEKKYNREIIELKKIIDNFKFEKIRQEKKAEELKEKENEIRLKLEELSIREKRIASEKLDIQEKEAWVLQELKNIKNNEKKLLNEKNIKKEEHTSIETGKYERKIGREVSKNAKRAIDSIKIFSGSLQEIQDSLKELKEIDFKSIEAIDERYMIAFSLLVFQKILVLENDAWGRWFLEKKEIKNIVCLLKVEKSVSRSGIYKEIPIIEIEKVIESIREIDVELKDRLIKIYRKKLKKCPKEISNLNSIEVQNELGKMYSENFYVRVRDQRGEKYYLYSDWGKICIDKSKAFVDTTKLPYGYYIANKINEKKEITGSSIGIVEKEYTFIPKQLNTDITNKTLNITLNEESELKKLGYNTSLGRVQRERVLKTILIPRLGRKSVESHLRWLIKMNRKKSSMENAVSIWKHDLNLIQAVEVRYPLNTKQHVQEKKNLYKKKVLEKIDMKRRVFTQKQMIVADYIYNHFDNMVFYDNSKELGLHLGVSTGTITTVLLGIDAGAYSLFIRNIKKSLS